MMNPINTGGFDKKGGKWGLIGKIGGAALAVGGAAAAPFTGGTSLAALPAGLGALGAAASTAGALLDPGKVTTQGPGPTLLETAVKNDPKLQISMLEDGQKAAATYPGFSLDQSKQIMGVLENAKKPLQERISLVRTS